MNKTRIPSAPVSHFSFQPSQARSGDVLAEGGTDRRDACSTTSTPRGFTLIELLVVVAILALLVSILMPSLQKAKELARTVVCLTNQKNCGTAFFLYADEWQGKTVVSWGDGGGAIALWPALYSGQPVYAMAGQTEYLRAGGLFGCPSNPAYPYDLRMGYYGTTNYAYGMYEAYTEHNTLFKSSPFAETILFAPPAYKPWAQVHHLSKIPNAAGVIWLADTSSTRSWEYGSPEARGRMVGSFSPHTELRWTSRIHLNHPNATANVLCYDGHAEAMGEQALNQSASNIKLMLDKDLNYINLP